MYLKSLTISTPTQVIRDIRFRLGINLIVDDTPTHNDKSTGNNVGKTTVLALIDFCLGGGAKIIWTDPESKRETYALVQDFLTTNEVKVTLVLKKDLADRDSKEVTIERNFLGRSKAVRAINRVPVLEKELKEELSKAILPDFGLERPTFRQLISHNIRYAEPALSNTLRTLDNYSKDVEYEALHLYMLGIDFTESAERHTLLTELQKEQNFKAKLEKTKPKSEYESLIAALSDLIAQLERKKQLLGLNENLEIEIDLLNRTLVDINRVGIETASLQTRVELIRQAENDLKTNHAIVDLQELRLIYAQTTQQLGSLHRTFEELVAYHNRMVDEKIRFITKELPDLEAGIAANRTRLAILREQEERYRNSITRSASFEELQDLLEEINDAHGRKGEYQGKLQMITSAEKTISVLESQLAKIDEDLFSSENEGNTKRQMFTFNRYFQDLSNELYGERYLLNYAKVASSNTGFKLYKFSTFNAAMSSGKKQGEIAAFDIAYTLFARDQEIPHLPFFLYDKKELVHDNQLSKIARLAERHRIQIITPILRDKLPAELNRDEYIVLRLSQEDKLFRIEQNS